MLVVFDGPAAGLPIGDLGPDVLVLQGIPEPIYTPQKGGKDGVFERAALGIARLYGCAWQHRYDRRIVGEHDEMIEAISARAFGRADALAQVHADQIAGQLRKADGRNLTLPSGPNMAFVAALTISGASGVNKPATTNFTASARAVLREIVREGSSTRPQIGAALGLSRPTMSAAIAELERHLFVEKTGVVKGSLGRHAARYRAGAGAGHVVSVDAGSTHIRLRVSSLDRRLLHSRIHRLPLAQLQMTPEISAAVADEVRGALEEGSAEWGPLRSIGVALPTRVVGPGEDASATRQDLLFSAFHPPEDIALVLENNVNCAAVAEGLYGAARGEGTFAYVQVGLKIGLGLMLGGQLIRGRNGAAGEVGHLPFPFAARLVPQPGALERHMSTEALMERVRTAWPEDGGTPPGNTSDLLRRAEKGNPAALGFVEQHAAEIGALIAACVSIIDPGLVILGGGYGSSPLLLPQASETARQLAYPVEVRSSALGADATVLGIEKLAIDHALTLILGD